MKNLKKFIAVATIVGSLGIAGTAYAASTNQADILAGLTGKTAAEITEQRVAGKTYGAIAQEAGKLAEFKTQSLEYKKNILDQRVKDGYLTQEQADQIFNSIKSNQAICDGTGSAGIGKRNGINFGQGMGNNKGQSNGKGFGGRMGRGLNS